MVPRSWRGGGPWGSALAKGVIGGSFAGDVVVRPRPVAAAAGLEPVHDLRLVRASQASRRGAAGGRSGQLADRAARVQSGGSGKQTGLVSLQSGSIEDDPGSHHPGCLRAVLIFLSGRADKVVHTRGFCAHRRRRLLRVPESIGMRRVLTKP